MTLRVFDAACADGFHHVEHQAAHVTEPDGVTWWDLENPTEQDIRGLGKIFGFHPLALEDVLKRRQRPKVEAYPNHLFLVLYSVGMLDSQREPQLTEVAMFIMPHAVITIHRRETADIDVAGHRWHEHCASDLPNTPSMLAYTICDSIVDGYFPAVDALGDTIEMLESAVFEAADTSTLEEVFRLKRVLLDLRRMVAPSRDVFNAFTRRELPLMGEVSVTYFQDVYDHVIRVTDAIDSYRDILSSVIDVHLTLVSNNLNQTVRTLTVASIILMSLALIAGIYGMNFENMPELRWQYGYFGALASMVIIGVGLGFIFRRIRWW